MGGAFIEAWGAYLPRWRLDRRELPAGGRGRRAVAAADEDSLTMAAEAALDCLGEEREVDLLVLATTTSPYAEKSAATLLAWALDLPERVVTLDLGGSLRAGTLALRVAAASIQAGHARRALVVASDCRLAPPGSSLEALFGDGAAALLLAEEGRAELRAFRTVPDEILDFWRPEGERFVRTWEDRFVEREGMLRTVGRALEEVMGKRRPEEFTALISVPSPRRARELAGRLGLQGAPALWEEVGYTGCADPLLLFCHHLEEAAEGRVLLAAYGGGVDLVEVELRGRVPGGQGLRGRLDGQPVDYLTYLRWRGLIPREDPPRPFGVTDPSASTIWRERDRILRLRGSRCRACGHLQYPPQRVCAFCGRRDEMESVRLRREGTLFTFSHDSLSGATTAVVDLEGGGRFLGAMSDCDPRRLSVGMKVRLGLRKVMVARGIHNYYWKAIPR